MSEFLDRISKLSPKRLQLLALELQTKLETLERQRHEPVAVVGMACRFPGGANDPESFWQLLQNGVDAITEVPGDRWDVNAYYDSDPDALGKMSSRWGGFLADVDKFDPQFFGISPREAESMDPQQRLLLEVSWQALENAGLSADKLDGSSTGVFLGICNRDYAQLLLERGPQAIDAYLASGSAHSVAAGRLSYFLGVHGPNLAVDTACSSSLVALHLAAQSLRNGECRAALAGGVNLILAPDVTVALSKAHMMASDGRCKAFAASADGFVRGEGCGVVVLKRLSDALADGDTILAVMRGSAINQDGRSNGLTAPNGPSQEAVIRAALANAGVEPGEMSYVETHGTGTSLGDPIEMKALGAVLGRGRSAANPLLIGSVKTNVGHLEAAAGIVGFIKLVLALQHRELPPHLHLSQRNPHIAWSELPIAIPVERTPWAADRRIAGLSSFGFSGTNAHIIVEEAPQPEMAKADVERPLHLLALSAKSEGALKELVQDYAAHSLEPVADVCFTANAGRAHFSHRLALIADSGPQLREKLNDVTAGKSQHSVVKTTPEVAFLFTGQGSQYAGMARQLYETQPSFRKTLDKCDELLRPYLNPSLLSLLYSPTGSPSLLDQTAYTQPALFAVEYALAELWRSWGVEPTVVLGHSVGEYVAACVAGVFSLEDGLKLIAERGRLMGALPGGGEMVAVFADEARVTKAIATAPAPEAVSIAAINGPANVVISGAGEAVQAVVKTLEAGGVKSKRLAVSHAFHSPLMKPMLDEFMRVASGINYSQPRIALISNVTGRAVKGSEIANAAYWHRHVMAAVQFAAAIQSARELGPSVFLEIGPGTTLLGLGQACLPEGEAAWLPSLRKGRDDWAQVLESLGALYVRGVNVDWAEFDHDYPRRKIVLPTYPFRRERYWFAGGSRRAEPVSRAPAQAGFADWLYEIEWQEQPRTIGANFLPAPQEIASQAQSHVAGLRARHHIEAYDELWPRLDAMCAAYVIQGLSKLGWKWQVGQRLSAKILMQQLPIQSQHRRLVERMLGMLGEDGLLTLAGSEWQVRRLSETQDPDAIWQKLLADYPAHSAELMLTGQCAQQLAEVLRGDVDPLQLLFPGGSLTAAENLYQSSPSSQLYNTLLREAVSAALATLPAGRRIRILEIGGGTGGTTSHVLPRLPAGQTDYVFTDVSPLFTNKARQKFAAYPFVQYQVLDAGKNPEGQGFEAGQFDMILAANVLHATGDLRQTLRHVQNLLAPGGLLVLLEGVTPQRFGDLTVGLTGGWWSFTDSDLRPSYALISQAQWLKVLTEIGFEGVACAPQTKDNSDFLSQQAVILARKPLAQTQAATAEGKWLILADEAGLGEQVAGQLQTRGAQITLARPGPAYERMPDGSYTLNPARPEDFERLLTVSSYRGVLHLWALDATQSETASPAGLDKTQMQGTASLLHLTQALAKSNNNSTALWLMTRGAQPAGEPAPLAVAQSPVWGLGGVITLEHPELNCLRIDLDPFNPAAQIEALMDEILTRDSKEDQIALRGQKRYARKLVRGAVDSRTINASTTFRAEATYLITGGLSGLGLLAAEWMAGRGARRLVLMGRSQPTETARAALEKLTRAGAQVVIAQADVSKFEQVEQVLADIASSGFPLAGLIHSAGVLDDGVILQQNRDRFTRVMAAKVDGAWNLHVLTQALPLDFFVLFSSGVSLLGRMGQSNHAAANAFLDALAHHRRALGLPALSINWGGWDKVGSVVTHKVGERILMEGLGVIEPEQGLQALDYLMRQAQAQVAVMPVNWPVFLQSFANGVPPLFAKFADQAQTPARIEKRGTTKHSLTQQLAVAPPNQRRAVLMDHVRAQAVKVLRLDPSQIDPEQPLNQLGLDSLMAVELRNVLSQSVGRSLPATLLFDHPSVNALTSYLGRDLLAEQTEKPKAGLKAQAEPVRAGSEHDHLSEDELAALLAKKLKRIG
ncbi:MAG: SDR family NAD(P)-dependent oxidoreductase [Chloroflexi bacterium]|nr:SDR family NAD(P)-dependent oxidoreductase [Chloroflexota bacterium]